MQLPQTFNAKIYEGDIIILLTSGKIAYSEFRVMMGAFPLINPK